MVLKAPYNLFNQPPMEVAVKQRDAVLLIYGEGLSHAAAAEVLGCAETTISWHVHEARKRLKVLLRDAAA